MLTKADFTELASVRVLQENGVKCLMLTILLMDSFGFKIHPRVEKVIVNAMKGKNLKYAKRV